MIRSERAHRHQKSKLSLRICASCGFAAWTPETFRHRAHPTQQGTLLPFSWTWEPLPSSIGQLLSHHHRDCQGTCVAFSPLLLVSHHITPHSDHFELNSPLIRSSKTTDMGLVKGGFLRLFQTALYALAFCCSAISLGIFSYFLATLADRDRPVSQ